VPIACAVALLRESVVAPLPAVGGLG
jgi:hypothetical protein